MPIYEFECLSCGKRFEELMRATDPDPAHCPCDRHAAVRRRVSAPQFRLAGSGWYETDFKGAKDVKRNLAGESRAEDGAGGAAKAGSGEASTTSGNAETKPAAPATPATGSGAASTA